MTARRQFGYEKNARMLGPILSERGFDGVRGDTRAGSYILSTENDCDVRALDLGPQPSRRRDCFGMTRYH